MAFKFKLTGFARFFLMLIIVAPAAYFGASYYNGEDPVANIKNIIGMETQEEHPTVNVPIEENKMTTPEVDDSFQVEQLKKELTMLERENDKLKNIIKNREQEIRALKNK